MSNAITTLRQRTKGSYHIEYLTYYFVPKVKNKTKTKEKKLLNFNPK